ncbi:MAG TPA: alkaline phosphatase family protein [Patescibacteria group bacterium]|nr:alkaline phosphatase family protein [Patescibacteria group bacterium]
MKRTYVYILAVCVSIAAACALAVTCVTAGIGKRPRSIILVGWDAASRDTVQGLMAQGRLPNLAALVSGGAFVDIDVQRITDTKAGWTEILTGYPPEITGTHDNHMYQQIPQGYTVFERLQDFFGKGNFITVAVISKKLHMDCFPPQRYDRIEDVPEDYQSTVRTELNPDGQGCVYFPGEPFAGIKDKIDVFVNDLRSNSNTLQEALRLLEKYRQKPFFFFVHFGDIDGAGHKFGVNAPQVANAVISCDACLGALVQKLKEYKIYDTTRIYVTADHGLDTIGNSHRDAPFIFLATNNRKVIRDGRRIDIAPTILEDFGVDLSKIKPALPGWSLTKIKRCKYCVRKR